MFNKDVPWGRDFCNLYVLGSVHSSGYKTKHIHYTPWISDSTEEQSRGVYIDEKTFIFFLSNIGKLKLTLNRLGWGAFDARPLYFFCPSTLIFDTLTVKFLNFNELKF